MAGVPFVYQEIKQGLMSRIGRQWPVGGRLPSASELARELGTGQRNTLRAMQELVREGYLRSRPGRGTFVATQLPSPPARQARQHESAADTRLLILLAPGHQDRFMLDIARAIECTVATHGIAAEFRIVSNKYNLCDPPYSDFDAIAILNPDNRRIEINQKQKAVIVSTINCIHITGDGGFDIVSIEEEHGGFLAGRLLREAGHETACFLGVRHLMPTRGDIISEIRLRGFEAGFGKPIPREHQLWATAFQDLSGAVEVPRYMGIPDRPRAIFAASDELAIGFAIGGATLGLKPGIDFDLVGFDGQHRGRELAGCPPLTSVAIPSQEMGRRAAELLLDRIQRPDKPVERVLLGCSIFAGGTVAQFSSSLSSSEIAS